jgi:FixJ family two-component response regulator
MATPDQVVYVIDDDPSMREAVKRLVAALGYTVESFASGREFLEGDLAEAPPCIVLDVRLQGLSGLDLQREMAEKSIQIPIIFITGHGDIPMSVQAMKAGAVEFLTKPFRDQDLLDAIGLAIERDRAARSKRSEGAERRARYRSPALREREVMTGRGFKIRQRNSRYDC